jgi:hypothetical protein
VTRFTVRSALLAALAALATLVVPSSQAARTSATAFLTPGLGGFTSPNVTYVGSIPTGLGVSARIVKVGKQRRLYLSSAHGLTIYDITDPALPVVLGELPIYNWENEDIAVSKDGARTVLTEYDSQFYIHVFDTSNPRLPVLRGSLLLDGSHTAECADPHCDYLFASNNKTYDLRGGQPVALPKRLWWSTQVGARADVEAHALHQDAAGYWIADENPLVMFEAADPLHPTRITSGRVSKGTAYQHNNVRPAANRYVPRRPGDHRKALRPGEMLMGEGETNLSPSCGGGSGAFSTWSMVGWDRGRPMRQLHVLRPVNGDYADGDPAVNALGCSGHWFSVREDEPGRYKGDYLVAAGWYEHGTRFLAVDRRTAKIRQVGFFQPVRGSASAAYWVPGTSYVYVVDYQRGVDILRFSATAAPPSPALTTRSWLAKLHTVDTISRQARFWCAQAMHRHT